MLVSTINTYNIHQNNVNRKPYCGYFVNFGMCAQKRLLNIKSRGNFPANILSNFSSTNFYFEGVKISSIEGFLQSLKTFSPDKQKEICAMSGVEAKMLSKSLKQSKDDILFFWDGMEFKRHSQEFKRLLAEVLEAQDKNRVEGGFLFKGHKIRSVNAFLLGIKTPIQIKQDELFQTPAEQIVEVGKSIKPIYDYRLLFWNGRTFSRISEEYKKLLTQIYDSRYNNDILFRQAIRASKKFIISHTKGKKDPRETVLTEQEFLDQIKRLQKKDSFFFKLKDWFKLKINSFNIGTFFN